MLPADRALMEQIGARLREIREGMKPKLSQEAVGERAGFTGKYIGEIEKGIRDVPLSTLRAVVEAGLGTTFDYVFSERPKRRGKPLTPVPLPRDIELTAGMLAALPMKMRRPIHQLVEAVVNEERLNERARGERKRR